MGGGASWIESSSFLTEPIFLFSSVSGSYSGQSGDVHPQRKWHPTFVLSSGDARTANALHLVQRHSNFHSPEPRQLRIQSDPGDIPAGHGEPLIHSQCWFFRFRKLHLHSGRCRTGQHRCPRPQRFVSSITFLQMKLTVLCNVTIILVW